MFTEVWELMMQWLAVSDLTNQVDLRPHPADDFGGKCAYFRVALLGMLETYCGLSHWYPSSWRELMG